MKELRAGLNCARDQATPSKGTLISDLMSKDQRCPTSSGTKLLAANEGIMCLN